MKKFNYDYQGNTPVEVGERVALLSEDGDGHKGKVTCTLATQFLAGGEFYFYKDEGVTWQRTKDK